MFVAHSPPFGLGDEPLKGPAVEHYFDNLLPDSAAIRRRLQRHWLTRSDDAFDLLAAIGRDCVGAVQLLPPDATPQGWNRIESEPLRDRDVAAILASVTSEAPLGQREGDDLHCEVPIRFSQAALGDSTALVLSLLLSLLVGLFSLRVKAIFFAMITLAVASAFQTLASQLSDFTGGEDGLSFKNPGLLSPAFEFEWLGLALDGRHLSYWLLFCVVTVLFLATLRVVNSPFGRVLQAIRENDFRAEAIGLRVVVYRTLSNVLAALLATVAGALLALWLRYTGPDTTLSFEIMLDVLLIVVIGGMGTLYGAVIGAALVSLLSSWFTGGRAPDLPLGFYTVKWVDWWTILLGLSFVAVTLLAPKGLSGIADAITTLAESERPFNLSRTEAETCFPEWRPPCHPSLSLPKQL